MNPKARSRLVLLLVATLFLLPFLVAVALRFGGWEPPNTRNFGTLLQPPVPVGELVGRRDEGGRWEWINTEHEWTLLVRVPDDCAEPCAATLEMLPNVRTALGRHAGRLHPFVLADAGLSATREMPFPLMRLEGPLPAPLSRVPDGSRVEAWLVDPHGFVVLHYPPGFDPADLRRDLSRLLR